MHEYDSKKGIVLGRLKDFAKDFSLDSPANVWPMMAWSYAVATWLHERARDSLFDRKVGPIRDLNEAVQKLADLPLSVGPSRLYGHLLQVLLAFDEWIDQGGTSLRAEARLLSMTPATPIRFENPLEDYFVGIVQHWFRPISVLSELTTRLEDSPSLRPVRYDPGPSAILRRTAYHWPRGGVRISPAPTRRGRTGPRLLTEKVAQTDASGFRIVLCPVSCSSHPRFRADLTQATFTVLFEDPMAEPDALSRHVDSVLATAASNSVRLLVLPELTVHPPERERIGKLLAAGHGSLHGMIPGSFHIPGEGEWQPTNHSLLFGHVGEVLLHHSKQGRFEVQTRHTPGKMFPEMPNPPPAHPLKLREGIRAGEELQILDARIGRILLLICADVLDEGDTLFNTAKHCLPNLVIILSMSPKCKEFWILAGRLERIGVGTLYVNSACIYESAQEKEWVKGREDLESPPEKLWAFVRLPYQYPGQEAPPTHIVWRPGAKDLDVYHFAEKEWQPLYQWPAEADSPHKAALFTWSDPPALELDLAAYLFRPDA